MLHGRFIMNNGEISENNSTTPGSGGGVDVNGGTFTMNGGEISGTRGSFSSPGVIISGGASSTFTMNGGEIFGNTGSGVISSGSSGTFRMNNGTIFGADAGERSNNDFALALHPTNAFHGASSIRSTLGIAAANPLHITTTIRAVNGALYLSRREGNLAEQFAWLRNYSQSGGEYIIELSADEEIFPVESGDIVANLPWGRNNLTIRLRGAGAMRNISVVGDGTGLFRVHSGVTLVLDQNITLHGEAINSRPLIEVSSGGTLIMTTGSRITGQTNRSTMEWGSGLDGGAVNVNLGGTFYMRGGTIFNNTAQNGGGVWNNGIFRISNGVIYGIDAAEGLRNTARGTGASLHNLRAAQRGTFDAAGIFTSLGDLNTTDLTIRVVNGNFQ